jgi:peptide chain release factor 3
VWDRRTLTAHLFERTHGGAFRAPVSTVGLTDPLIRERLDDVTYRQVCEEVELLEGAGTAYDPHSMGAANTTPVYFGSAVNNFGIELLLDGFLEHAPPPASRQSRSGAVISPDDPAFSGFVFKIQANMDPQHRDRIAFIRVVSGKFSRNMAVTHVRTGRKVRLSNASAIFGAERETVDDAYPGDVVGIVGRDEFAIGDTLAEDPAVVFDEIPVFAPECFAYIENTVPAEAKRFRTGFEQLLQEGVAQAFDLRDMTGRTRLLGAAGPLQFEVMQYRLESEYGARSQWTIAPWKHARWLRSTVAEDGLFMISGMKLVLDGAGQPVVLFRDDWARRYFEEKNPDVETSPYPFDGRASFKESEAQG